MFVLAPSCASTEHDITWLSVKVLRRCSLRVWKENRLVLFKFPGRLLLTDLHLFIFAHKRQNRYVRAMNAE